MKARINEVLLTRVGDLSVLVIIYLNTERCASMNSNEIWHFTADAKPNPLRELFATVSLSAPPPHHPPRWPATTAMGDIPRTSYRLWVFGHPKPTDSPREMMPRIRSKAVYVLRNHD
jgi:hypothetical protein